MMNKSFLLICFSIFILSCSTNKKKNVDVSKVEVSFKVHRFDQEFYHTSIANYHKLKKKYSYLFPKQYADSVWIKKIKNSEEIKLSAMADSVYGDFKLQTEQLTSLFKHIKYYYPRFKSPTVTTLISGLDYDNSMIYADSLLLVSLDMYLGSNSIVYKDFPEYLSQNYTRNQLIVTAAKEISKKIIVPNGDRIFLSKIIQKGKFIYLINKFLPSFKEREILGYSKKKFDWINKNEQFVWKYFIQNKLLYSTDRELNNRFLNKAPFSKFYLSIDTNSPGRVGEWLGWRIVNSYMTHNDVSLRQLLSTNYQTVFNNSKYKPRK